jgi:4-coumarate--CoA ligase
MQDKMPTESPFQIDIPSTNLLTYLFPSEEDDSVSDKPIWIDADDIQHALSPRQLLHWVKRLGAGLQGLGLKEQDVVMVYSLNHIFVPVAYAGVAGGGYVFSGCNPAYGVDGMFDMISLERNDMRCYEGDMRGCEGM